MRENEAPVWSDVFVALEREGAMHQNKASVRRDICVERSSPARPPIEEARMLECEAGVHGTMSPVQCVVAHVQRGDALLRSRNARVQRSFTRLHMSYAHVHRDIAVVH
jgi:hypothetical protein